MFPRAVVPDPTWHCRAIALHKPGCCRTGGPVRRAREGRFVQPGLSEHRLDEGDVHREATMGRAGNRKFQCRQLRPALLRYEGLERLGRRPYEEGPVQVTVVGDQPTRDVDDSDCPLVCGLVQT